MSNSNKKPDFDVFQILQLGDKAQWNKIGVAWNIKGGAINVQLNSIPLDGKIQLRVPQSKDESDA